MGYKSTKADPDVWILQANKPNGFCYYEILLVYVDDILCVSHQLEKTMEQKDDSVGAPTRYLGANVGKFQLWSGLECRSASARVYIKSAVGTWSKFCHKIPFKASSGIDLTGLFP